MVKKGTVKKSKNCYWLPDLHQEIMRLIAHEKRVVPSHQIRVALSSYFKSENADVLKEHKIKC